MKQDNWPADQQGVPGNDGVRPAVFNEIEARRFCLSTEWKLLAGVILRFFRARTMFCQNSKAASRCCKDTRFSQTCRKGLLRRVRDWREICIWRVPFGIVTCKNKRFAGVCRTVWTARCDSSNGRLVASQPAESTCRLRNRFISKDRLPENHNRVWTQNWEEMFKWKCQPENGGFRGYVVVLSSGLIVIFHRALSRGKLSKRIILDFL